jgi:hypothetical protein
VAFPASLTLITVNVRADLLPAGGSAGWARLRYDLQPLTGAAADSIVAYVDETATFAADGTGTLQVPATNATGWTPQDFSYAVTVCSGSQVRHGTVQLDRGTPTVNLADVIQWDGAAEQGVTYATVAQLGEVDARIDALGISDVAGLQVQLNAKAPLASPTFTGTVAGISKSMVGLGNVDNLADPMPSPLDHGLVGWTWDPIHQQAGTVVPTAGLAHVVRIRALGPVVTNIHVHVTVAGSVLTANQCYMALYNDAGALLGAGAITASLHNTGTNGWGDTGAKVHPLSTPQGVTTNAWYKVLFWYQGTTGPAFSRNTNAGSSMLNIGLTAGTARYATANSGLTTAGTVPANIGATSGGSTAWWVGLS